MENGQSRANRERSFRQSLPNDQAVQGCVREPCRCTGYVSLCLGVPGVQQERLTEGLIPVHCALSLVGEPIMYPQINTLIDTLHSRAISTFLVTNAQFPAAIRCGVILVVVPTHPALPRNLLPVTQLYVSVDASTEESLKKIDRPLFKDYWARFIDSLKALSQKVRLTAVSFHLPHAGSTHCVQTDPSKAMEHGRTEGICRPSDYR